MILIININIIWSECSSYNFRGGFTMFNKKRILVFIFSVLFVLSCGGSGSDDSEGGGGQGGTNDEFI